MWNELVHGATDLEAAGMLLLIAGMGFALLIPPTWIAHKIFFLNERPDQRAIRTTAVAYVVAALVAIFGFGEFLSAWAGPLIPIPGAVAIFFWLRADYRRGWVEDHEVAGDLKLENSDWRIGLGLVISVIVAAAIKVLLLRA